VAGAARNLPPDGQIAVSWFSGSFREVVDRCTRSFNAGRRSSTTFPVARARRARAVAETNIVIWCARRSGTCSPT
jgi:hypothetical protein